MVRRVIIILVALALAVAGTWVILSWVDRAEERELADVQRVEVLVATRTIESGTRAANLVLGEDVVLIEVLERSQVVGAVQELSALSGLVAEVDIIEGEQLSTVRFVEPAALEASSFPEIDVPEGLLEVSFQFSDVQFIGGKPEPGDYVAYIAIFDPFTVQPNLIEPGAVDDLDDLFSVIQETEPAEEEDVLADGYQTPQTVHILAHKLLVTNIQYPSPPALTDEEGNPVEQDPRAIPGVSIVTLAAPAPVVERMVFTNEWGRVWLALETLDDSEEGTDFITRANVFP
jgi:pilus assembly protein CpaB